MTELQRIVEYECISTTLCQFRNGIAVETDIAVTASFDYQMQDVIHISN